MTKGLVALLVGMIITSIIVGAIGDHETRIYDAEEEWDE